MSDCEYDRDVDEVGNASFDGTTVETRTEYTKEWMTKVIAPGKIDPYKCFLPSLNISVERNVVSQFKLLSVAFIGSGQNVNKHHIP